MEDFSTIISQHEMLSMDDDAQYLHVKSLNKLLETFRKDWKKWKVKLHYSILEIEI